MMFLMPTWQVVAQLPYAKSAYSFQVTDDDLDGFCRTLRMNNCQSYTVAPIDINPTISQADLDEDCGCGGKNKKDQ